MGKRVVDDASLTAVADKLREEFPDEKLTFPGGFIQGIDRYAKVFETRGRNTGWGEGYTDGYNGGKAAGLGEGAAICAAKHFTYNFIGDGSGSVSFHVPFEPDAVQIYGYDTKVLNMPNTLLTFGFDLRALGRLGGTLFYSSSGNGSAVGNQAAGYSRVLERYSRTEDGVVTIKDVGGTSVSLVFGNGCLYTAVAVKYTEQTDKERITDFVNRLTGSGTAALNKAKVEAAFTNDEWAALIATKPNWTFTLF